MSKVQTKKKRPNGSFTLCLTKAIHFLFALQPFNAVNSHLRQVHQMTPNLPWTPKGQKCLIYVMVVPLSPKFQLISLVKASDFWVELYVEKNCTECPNQLEYYKVRVSHMCYQYTCIPNFNLFHSMTHFRVAGHFETCALIWPKNSPKTLKKRPIGLVPLLVVLNHLLGHPVKFHAL